MPGKVTRLYQHDCTMRSNRDGKPDWHQSGDPAACQRRNFFDITEGISHIGSALMLAAILVLGYLHQQQTGRWSFDLLDLYSV
ncbi:MAG: hypothetical protein N2423_07735, partial [Novosphingobium sp.]|nr:hypothetical protein [Novosphingobium sp.]